jgi:DNA modification methylase
MSSPRCTNCHRSLEALEPLRHRLLCGDSRDPKQVDRLFDGTPANVVITSPPYASQRQYDESSGFKPIAVEEYVAWYRAVASTIASHLAPDGSYFLNIKAHAEDGERSLYVMDLVIAHKRQWGWMFRDEFIWKHSGFPGEYRYRHRNQFEPIYHFTREHHIKHRPLAVGHASDLIRDNGGGRGHGGSRMVATNQENDADAGNSLPFRSGIAQVGNVIECAVNTESTGHKAAFPRGLPEFFVSAFTDPGDVVYDPFMGSGTSMAAAHVLGRSGFGCEISPAYCDVILERLAHLGASSIRLAATGQTFEDVAQQRQAAAHQEAIA